MQLKLCEKNVGVMKLVNSTKRVVVDRKSPSGHWSSLVFFPHSAPTASSEVSQLTNAGLPLLHSQRLWGQIAIPCVCVGGTLLAHVHDQDQALPIVCTHTHERSSFLLRPPCDPKRFLL